MIANFWDVELEFFMFWGDGEGLLESPSTKSNQTKKHGIESLNDPSFLVSLDLQSNNPKKKLVRKSWTINSLKKINNSIWLAVRKVCNEIYSKLAHCLVEGSGSGLQNLEIKNCIIFHGSLQLTNKFFLFFLAFLSIQFLFWWRKTFTWCGWREF